MLDLLPPGREGSSLSMCKTSVEDDPAAIGDVAALGSHDPGMFCQLLASPIVLSLENSFHAEVRSNYIGVECWSNGHLVLVVAQGSSGETIQTTWF